MSESALGNLQLSRVNYLLQVELVDSHYGVAKVFQRNRDFSGTVEAYSAGLTIAKSWANRGLDNVMWQGLLAVGYGGRGGALMNLGDYAGALKEFRKEKQVQERMAAEYPNDPRQQLALALIQQSIGGLLSVQGDQAGAVDAFRQSVVLLRQHSRKINNGKSELAKALGSLSVHCLLGGQFAEAKAAAEEGYSLDEKQVWILINLAHAEMFLGHTDAAMELHVKHINDVIPENGNKRWREVVVDDFAALNKRGLKSPNMINIEQLMTKKR